MPEFVFDMPPIDLVADYSFTWQWLREDVPVNLTGYSASFIVYCDDPATPALTVTSASGAITLDSSGYIRGTITKAALNAAKDLVEGDYTFQLDVTSGANVTTRLAKGHIPVLKRRITSDDP